MLMKLNNVLFFLLIINSVENKTNARDWQWANKIGITNSDTKINAINKYTGDNIIVAGSFTSPTLSFSAHTLTNSGQEDGFFAVLDKNGNYLWANKIGGIAEDQITKIASDKFGNIYVAGNYKSLSLNVGGYTLINSGESDGFLVKFSPSNAIEWAKSISTNLIDEITGLAVDSTGNVYVGGHSNQHPAFNVFIMKFDSNSNLLWDEYGATPDTTGNYLVSTSLTLDNNQNVYFSGSVYGLATFSNTQTIGNGSAGGFIVKYNSSGSFATGIADTNFTQVNSMASFNNELYVCGEKKTWGMGWGWPLQYSKIYVAKYTDVLNKVWQKENGGTPINGFNENYDVAKTNSIDELGNAYVAGFSFSDTLHFANDELLNVFYQNYYYPQAFVFKYGPTGSELWGKFIGGYLVDEASVVLAASDDAFYLGGVFESDSISFDNLVLENTGTLDTLYVHLSPFRYQRKQLSFISFYENDSLINVGELNGQSNISIFPNPGNEYFFIEFKTKPTSIISVAIYAIDGRLIKTEYYNSPTTLLKTAINELVSGIYFIVVDSNNSRTTHKLIKE